MKLPAESYSLPEWHNHPLHLTREQINDPGRLLRNFFDLNPLPDLRDMMSNWLRDTMDDKDDIPTYILWLYDDLLPVLEAACLLCRSTG